MVAVAGGSGVKRKAGPRLENQEPTQIYLLGVVLCVVWCVMCVWCDVCGGSSQVGTILH